MEFIIRIPPGYLSVFYIEINHIFNKNILVSVLKSGIHGTTESPFKKFTPWLIS